MKITQLADKLLVAGNRIHLLHWASRGSLGYISHVEIAGEIYELFTGQWYDDLMEGADQHGETLVDPNFAAQREKVKELVIQSIDYRDVISCIVGILEELYVAYKDVHDNYSNLLTGFKAVTIEGHMREIEVWLKYKLKRWT